MPYLNVPALRYPGRSGFGITNDADLGFSRRPDCLKLGFRLVGGLRGVLLRRELYRAMAEGAQTSGGSLGLRLVVSGGALLGIAGAIWVWTVYGTAEDNAIGAHSARLKAIACTVAGQVSSEAHETSARLVPTKDGFTRWQAAPDSVRGMRDILVKAKRSNALRTEIYTLTLRPERRAQVLANPDEFHEDAMEFYVSSAQTPYWRHTYRYRPDMKPTLFEGEAAASQLYSDEHGEWLSAYAPIKNSEGQIIAILEVDDHMDVVVQTISDNRFDSIGTALALVLIIFGGFGSLSIQTASAISDLAHASGRLGRGDYETPFVARGTDEAQTLAVALEMARKRVRSDINERRKSEARLATALEGAESAARAKALFLANVSHEIRTPIHGIQGVLELLSATPLSPEQREYLRSLCTSGEALNGIINDLLDFTRIEASAIELNEASLNPSQVLQDVHRLVRGRAETKGLAVHTLVSGDAEGAVIGDVVRLRQILVNLAENAVKFTSQGRVDLSVTALRRDDAHIDLCFEIKDTGIGISPSLQEHIYDPFFQGDTSETRKYGGNGLGLSIAQQLTQLMGGRIELTSEPGQGSHFRLHLRLPIADKATTEDEVDAEGVLQEQLHAARSRGTPLRLLIVEDNPVNMLVARRLTQRMGYDIECAEHGGEALEICEQRAFDVILMDCQMPVMDGFEATRRLRKDIEWAKAVPILGVTANVTRADAARCLAAGMNAHLPKPFRPKQLAQTLMQFPKSGPPD